jgi:Mor family transcriptional regulator
MENKYIQQSNILRDAEIYDAYHISERGISYRKLGERHNLSGQRIEQIIKKVAKSMGVNNLPIDTIPGNEKIEV